MKQSLFFISLSLCLVLIAATPASALAAKPVPFATSGTISSISPGTVFPAGNSGRWVIVERELSGTLTTGDITGAYTMVYKGNVESVETQSGNFHGTLNVSSGAYVLKVNGKSEPLELLRMIEIAPGIWVPVLRLSMGGHWVFTTGANGQGEFSGWVEFIPTPEGHVYSIVGSSFTMAGQWQH